MKSISDSVVREGILASAFLTIAGALLCLITYHFGWFQKPALLFLTTILLVLPIPFLLYRFPRDKVDPVHEKKRSQENTLGLALISFIQACTLIVAYAIVLLAKTADVQTRIETLVWLALTNVVCLIAVGNHRRIRAWTRARSEESVQTFHSWALAALSTLATVVGFVDEIPSLATLGILAFMTAAITVFLAWVYRPTGLFGWSSSEAKLTRRDRAQLIWALCMVLLVPVALGFAPQFHEHAGRTGSIITVLLILALTYLQARFASSLWIWITQGSSVRTD